MQRDYDTFGSTAAEIAKRHAGEVEGVAGLDVGFLPAEMVAPVADSIGIKLLTKVSPQPLLRSRREAHVF